MKNPKTVIGVIALAVLVIALGVLVAVWLLPTIAATRLEMSLTPTPLPPWPGSVMAVTPDPDAPTPEPVLRTGSAGQAVKDLQGRLYTLGYYQGEIDGKFGTATKEAVILFQRANALEADGIVGSETKTVLFSAEAKPYTEEETAEVSPEIHTAVPKP
ncbi:MAG: peptidoglycan-binding protein [Clostridiales bacterium]|nr:peptidoglycan-binding protein [Clostridiales bacterium]